VNTPLGVIVSNISVLTGYGESLGQLALVARQAASTCAATASSTPSRTRSSGLGAADFSTCWTCPALTTDLRPAQTHRRHRRSVSIFAQSALA
jgi:hypothetical protein